MLLDHIVTRTGRNVIAIGPDRRPRIVRKERPQEFVAIVWAERIRSGAHGITHRVGALRTRLSRLVSLAALRCLPSLSLWAGSRHKKASGRPGLTWLSSYAQLSGLTGSS